MTQREFLHSKVVVVVVTALLSTKRLWRGEGDGMTDEVSSPSRHRPLHVVVLLSTKTYTSGSLLYCGRAAKPRDFIHCFVPTGCDNLAKMSEGFFQIYLIEKEGGE